MATNAKIPEAALPSAITRPGDPEPRHPADDDGRTLAQGPTTDGRRTSASQDARADARLETSRVAPESGDPAPMTPLMGQRTPSTAPPPSIPPAEDGGTLIMDHLAFASKTVPIGPNARAAAFAPQNAPQNTPAPQGFARDPRASRSEDMMFAADPRASRSEDMMFVAGPARPAPARERSAGRSALAFIGVALVSMLIVVVTGLLILAASEP
jgi:hypothetical protein